MEYDFFFCVYIIIFLFERSSNWSCFLIFHIKIYDSFTSNKFIDLSQIGRITCVYKNRLCIISKAGSNISTFYQNIMSKIIFLKSQFNMRKDNLSEGKWQI